MAGFFITKKMRCIQYFMHPAQFLKPSFLGTFCARKFGQNFFLFIC